MTTTTREERTRIMASLSAGLREYAPESDQWIARTVSLGDDEPIIEIQFSRKIGDTHFNMTEAISFLQVQRLHGSINSVAWIFASRWKSLADAEAQIACQ